MSTARRPSRRSNANPPRKAASSKSKAKPKATSKKSTTRKASEKTAKKATSKKKATRKTAAKKTAATNSPKKAPVKRGSTTSSDGKRTTRTASGSQRPTTRASGASRTGARKGPKLDRKALAKIREQLLAERRSLEGQMTELEEESFQGTQSELTGEVGVDEDFADAGSATFDREQALSIQNNIRDLMDQTDRALARIDDGSYGSCERCGRPIEPARLKALPRTLLCTDCKRREERAR